MPFELDAGADVVVTIKVIGAGGGGGNAANFIEIKTFHSYCFDLLGKIGTLEASENIVKDAAEMIFGRGIAGDAPTVGLTVFVLTIFKVGGDDITAHLQAGQNSIEAFASVFAKAALLFEVHRQQGRVFLQGLPYLKLGLRGQALVPAGVQVVAIAAMVGKIGEQAWRNKDGFISEELAIGTAALAYDGAFPFPWAILRIGKPQSRVDTLFDGESGDLVLEKGDKAPFIDQF